MRFFKNLNLLQAIPSGGGWECTVWQSYYRPNAQWGSLAFFIWGKEVEMKMKFRKLAILGFIMFFAASASASITTDFSWVPHTDFEYFGNHNG